MKLKRISREPLALFPDTLRTCSGCTRRLPREAFARARNTKDGLASQCRDCNGARAKEYRLANRQKQIQTFMERHRRLKYGLSPEAYAAMIAAQQNKCAICERQMGKAPGTIFVDDPNWWKWWVWRFMPPGEERDEYARRAFESLKPETQEQLRKEYKPRIRVRARTAS